MGKPILCLDFDGVIHSYESGWKGADVIPDPPVEGAIAFMLGALDKFDVAIFSSRSNQKGGIDAMRTWLQEHAGNCWNESPCGPGIEDVRFVKEKPPALVTIDDRALTFTGEWPNVDELMDFKPWNKRAILARQPAAIDKPVSAEYRCRKCGDAAEIKFSYARTNDCCRKVPCERPGKGPCDMPAAIDKEAIRSLIADDAYAMSFQSMGQYRSALLKTIAAPLAPRPWNCFQDDKQPLTDHRIWEIADLVWQRKSITTDRGFELDFAHEVIAAALHEARAASTSANVAQRAEAIYQAKIIVDPKWTDVTKSEFDNYVELGGFDTRVVYAAPPAQTAITGRVLTYRNQPDNVGAWQLGEACRRAAELPAGDYIDRGLGLLKELQAKGYGVIALTAAQSASGDTK
jgi:hypothetical protein